MGYGCSSACLQDLIIISLPESFKFNLQCRAPFFCSLFYCIRWVSQVVIALEVFHRNFRVKFYFLRAFLLCRRFRWPRGLRRGSAVARLLGLRVRIPPGAWIFVSCDCYVLCRSVRRAGFLSREFPPSAGVCVCVCVCVISCNNKAPHLLWVGRCWSTKKDQCPSHSTFI